MWRTSALESTARRCAIPSPVRLSLLLSPTRSLFFSHPHAHSSSLTVGSTRLLHHHRYGKKKDEPAIRGIEIVIDHYRSRGFDCYAIFPAFWLSPPKGTHNRFGKRLTKLSAGDYELIERLQREQLVHASPSGDHDDFFHIISTFPHDGYVVTNDQFRDHDTRHTIVGNKMEKQAAFRDWKKRRLITVTFVGDEFLPGENCPVRLEIASGGEPDAASGGGGGDVSPSTLRQISANSVTDFPTLPGGVSHEEIEVQRVMRASMQTLDGDVSRRDAAMRAPNASDLIAAHAQELFLVSHLLGDDAGVGLDRATIAHAIAAGIPAGALGGDRGGSASSAEPDLVALREESLQLERARRLRAAEEEEQLKRMLRESASSRSESQQREERQRREEAAAIEASLLDVHRAYEVRVAECSAAADSARELDLLDRLAEGRSVAPAELAAQLAAASASTSASTSTFTSPSASPASASASASTLLPRDDIAGDHIAEDDEQRRQEQLARDLAAQQAERELIAASEQAAKEDAKAKAAEDAEMDRILAESLAVAAEKERVADAIAEREREAIAVSEREEAERRQREEEEDIGAAIAASLSAAAEATRHREQHFKREEQEAIAQSICEANEETRLRELAGMGSNSDLGDVGNALDHVWSFSSSSSSSAPSPAALAASAEAEALVTSMAPPVVTARGGGGLSGGASANALDDAVWSFSSSSAPPPAARAEADLDALAPHATLKTVNCRAEAQAVNDFYNKILVPSDAGAVAALVAAMDPPAASAVIASGGGANGGASVDAPDAAVWSFSSSSARCATAAAAAVAQRPWSAVSASGDGASGGASAGASYVTDAAVSLLAEAAAVARNSWSTSFANDGGGGGELLRAISADSTISADFSSYLAPSSAPALENFDPPPPYQPPTAPLPTVDTMAASSPPSYAPVVVDFVPAAPPHIVVAASVVTSPSFVAGEAVVGNSIGAWLAQVGLARYEEGVAQQVSRVDAFAILEETDVREISSLCHMTIEHRRIFLNSWKDVRDDAAARSARSFVAADEDDDEDDDEEEEERLLRLLMGG